MMLRVNDSYLEINELIEVEKKVKLFEDVSTTEGDFSYSFVIPRTGHNDKVLSIYTPNNYNKPWTRKIPAQIISDSGIVMHTGFLRVENQPGRDYNASFFSGNTNWIDELNFNLLDLDWSEYDKDSVTIGGVNGTYANTSGMVFPLTDRGILSLRKNEHFSEDDFQGYLYAKNIVDKILTTSGIKLQGELIKNPIYNNLITSAGNNKLLQNEIENREIYAAKTGTQVVSTVSSGVITFQNVTTPYFNSPLGNWDTTNSRYTFDLGLRDYQIDLNLVMNDTGYWLITVVKNGTDTLYSKGYYKVKRIQDSYTVKQLIDTPSVGDYYEIRIKRGSFSSGDSVVAGSTVRIKPKSFFKIFASTIIPDMTGSTFLSNIFRMLNMLVEYNGINKTITTTNLDTALKSEPIDISEYVTINEDNYEEFVSDYSRENLLVWQDQNNDLVDEYNETNIYPYGSGVLTIDNEFLEPKNELVEMDFQAPFQSPYGALGIDLPLTDFISVSVVETRDITGVTDVSDLAYFNYSGSAMLETLVRISESTIEEYNGDYFAVSAGSNFLGYVPYAGNATAKMEILSVKLKSSDPVFLLNNPGLNIGDVSGVDEFYAGNLVPQTGIAIANFLPTDNFIGSLSFEDLKNQYFKTTEKVLNTGVKAYATGNIPDAVYNNLTFRRTVRINERVYYINKITGYKGSKYSCTLELIKV